MSQLPPRGPFVGRNAELERLVEALEHAGLVSVIGPGGVGKTRLVAECTRRVAADSTPVLVWLDEIVDPTTVATHVGRAVGLADPGASLERIVEALDATPGLLLVLDNAEHVIDGVRAFVEKLPLDRVRVLVTTRVPLDIGAERRVVLDVLPSDQARELLDSRVQLLGGGPVVGPVDELLRALDYLPLAIELAAARTVILTPQQILERLKASNEIVGSRSPNRHGTLDRTIAWSWDLLDPSEKEIAATVAWFDLPVSPTLVVEMWPEHDVFNVAQDLEAKSWLRVVDTPHGKHWTTLWAMRRFVETEVAPELHARRIQRLVDFALAHLDESAGWWAEHVPAGLEAVDEFLARDDPEHAALVIARAFFGAFGGPYFDRAMSTAAHILDTWSPDESPVVWARTAAMLAKGAFRGASRYSAVDWARRGFEVAPPGTVSRLTSGAQYALCLIDDGQREESDALFDDIVEQARATPDDMSLASALLDLSTVGHEMGRFGVTRELCERMRKIAVEAGDVDAQARAWIHLSYVSYDLGDFERAAMETHQLDLLLGDRHPHERLAVGGAIPALVALQQGRDDEAKRSLDERAELARETRYHAMEFFVTLGHAAWAARNEPASVRKYLQRAMALARMTDSTKSISHAAFLTALEDALEGDWSSALERLESLRRSGPPASPRQWFDALDAVRWFCRNQRGDDSSPAPETDFGRLFAAVSSGQYALHQFLDGSERGLWNIPGLYMLRLDDVARRFVERSVVSNHRLFLEAQARRFRIDDGDVCDISRRGALRRIVARLAEARNEAPGVPVNTEAIIHAGWPDEKILHEAALTRVYTTMNRIRKLDIGPYLLTLDDGYALDVRLDVVWVDDLGGEG